MSSSKYLIIMRGLPGSGKSYRAKSIKDFNGKDFPTVICSADDYRMNDKGEYEFDPKKNGEAHAYCYGRAHAAMQMGVGDVIIDNTNVRKWEYERYIKLAETYDYIVKEAVSDTDWAWDVDECFKRCTHGVPKEAIQRMKDSFEL